MDESDQNVATRVGEVFKDLMDNGMLPDPTMKSKVGRGPQYPGVVAVIMRSMITGSLDHRDAVVSGGMADLLLDFDLRGVGLLDFERVREVATMGYEHSMPRLEAWLEGRREAGLPSSWSGV